jgi:hypothetical protein
MYQAGLPIAGGAAGDVLDPLGEGHGGVALELGGGQGVAELELGEDRIQAEQLRQDVADVQGGPGGAGEGVGLAQRLVGRLTQIRGTEHGTLDPHDPRTIP